MDKITLQTMSAFPGKLTEMAGEAYFDAIPFCPYAKGDNDSALVLSVAGFLKHLKEKPDTGFRVMNATAFHKGVNDNATPNSQNWWPYPDDDVILLTFSTRGDKKPAAMVVVRPSMAASFTNATDDTADTSYISRCSLSPNIFSDSFAPPAGELISNGNVFNQKFSRVAAAVSDGRIVWQPQYHIACLQNDTALKLRSALFPDDASIIEDTTVKEFVTRPAENREHCVEKGQFLRLTHPPSNFRKYKEHPYTMVPWYSAMFLETDEEGFISGISSLPRIKKCFNLSTLIQTNYSHLNITLVPPQERIKGRRPKMQLHNFQQRVLERALRGNITIQGRNFAPAEIIQKLDETPKTSRLYPTVYDGHADFSTSINRDGSLSHNCLALGGAQHLERLAVDHAETVVIRAAGQDFHFSPA